MTRELPSGSEILREKEEIRGYTVGKHHSVVRKIPISTVIVNYYTTNASYD